MYASPVETKKFTEGHEEQKPKGMDRSKNGSHLAKTAHIHFHKENYPIHLHVFSHQMIQVDAKIVFFSYYFITIFQIICTCKELGIMHHLNA